MKELSLKLMSRTLSGFLISLIVVSLSLASEHHGEHGGHGHDGPDMVPVVRTEVVPVEVEHSVGASDAVTYTVGPRTSVSISDPMIIPDNFVRSRDGEFAEGISLAGEISRTIQYLEGEAAPPEEDGGPIFAQIQVTSKDKKRESSVIRQEINLAQAQLERRVEGNRITLIRRFPLRGVFIPYTQLGGVIFDPRGALVRQVILTVVLVDMAGNILVGPGGAVMITRPITIGSIFLPPRIRPGIPWPIWSPVVWIPRCPIPFPGMITRTPTRGGIGTSGTIGGAIPGRNMGAGTTATGGTSQPAGTGAIPGRSMGAGTGQTTAGTNTAGTNTAGTNTAGTTTGGTTIGGTTIGGASTAVPSSTMTVTIPSKKQVVYWFSLPEKDGNRHEVTLQLTNFSTGIGLANLSVISKDQEKEYKRTRALIDALPNISVALETGQPEELKTLDLSDKVAAIPPENRTYILVLAAPTIEDNLLEIKLDPAWAMSQVFQESSEMSLPTKIKLEEAK